MDDLISRQTAINALKEHRALYCDNTPDTFSKLSYAEKSRVDELDTAIATLVNLPSAEPTLYGYNINHLAFIAGIMAKKGITAEEAIEIFKDTERLFKLISDDVQENFRIAIEKAVTR